MRKASIAFGILSVPVYFFGPIFLFVWDLRNDDTLVWMWLFGGWIVLFPLFALSCFAGYVTYLLCLWFLRNLKGSPL
jgi:hypothetical protein